MRWKILILSCLMIPEAKMNVVIKVIPHEKQRYDTVGDWWWEGGTLQMRVSKMSDWRYEMLVAFHEMAEALICKFKGIRQEEVDAFDTQFEKARKPGNEDEPGDDPKAPYYEAHQIAVVLEHGLALAFRVDWKKYNKEVMSL